MCINGLARTGVCVLVFLTSILHAESACDVPGKLASVEHLLRSHDFAAGIAALNQVETCNNLSPVERFRMGWLYGRARHFSEALRMFSSVPDNLPDPQSHSYAVALAHFEMRDYKQAVADLKRLETVEPLNPESINLLAVSYSKLSMYPQAQTTLIQEIEKHPDNQPAYLNLVTLYSDQGMFADAARIATKAVESFPLSPEVFIVRGAANTLLGSLDKAREDFSTASKLAPGQADPRFFLALTEYKQGNFTGAAESLKTALASGIADSDLHYLLAECLLKLPDISRVDIMNHLDQALALNPNCVSARNLRGRLLLDAGKTKKGAEDLEIAYQQDPSSRSAAYNLARAYRTLGRVRESESLFMQFRGQGGDAITELGDRRLAAALSETGTLQ
jgi:tetratricopeptide (TPR) repeat protein